MQRLSDLELLARLVAFDTTSHLSNLPLTGFVADYLDRPGVRIRLHSSPAGDKANLLVQLGPDGDAGRGGLVLSGHMDVVPAGEQGWESHPFTLTQRGSRVYGRGTCDMKGFLALATNVAAALDPAELRHPLVLLFTYDEEVGTLGARRFAESWAGPALPRAAIVGEPTALRVVHAHKGIVQLRITVTGKSAHSGYPHLGESAIEPAARIANALADLRVVLERERIGDAALFPDVPFVALNIGTIRGGTAANVVPDHCELVVTLRPLPGSDSPELIERVQAAVRRAARGAPVTVETTAESPPLRTSGRAPALAALLETLSIEEMASVSYATDAGWLQQLGLDCAVFGPGDIAVAHQPNEYVEVGDLARARQVLEQLVRRFCT